MVVVFWNSHTKGGDVGKKAVVKYIFISNMFYYVLEKYVDKVTGERHF